MCQNDVSVTNINGEHSIRQRISYDALKLDYVVFGQVFTYLLGFDMEVYGNNLPTLFVIHC